MGCLSMSHLFSNACVLQGLHLTAPPDSRGGLPLRRRGCGGRYGLDGDMSVWVGEGG
jgi:hypothetical protein